MKRYIYQLFMAIIASATMVACSDDEGTNPGSDSKPVVTIYQYSPNKPYNPDNDVVIRFATNNKTADAYYLAEKASEKNTHITSMGEDGYMDYVITNGIKLSEVSGESNIDVTLTNMFGEYAITAVVVAGNTKTSATSIFTGLDWEDVASGTYYFGTTSIAGTPAATLVGETSNPTVLQVCTTDATLYRFKDVFGTGNHMKINLIDIHGNDAGGDYQFFRVPTCDTPYNHPTNDLPISVRDVGYWQGSDSFVTENGYESGMYKDYTCFILLTYFTSGGTHGYGYDEFVVD